MQLQTFQYRDKQGWSVSSFPDLDSENTLVLLFCSPDFKNQPQIIHELAKYFPKSKIIGCSSAGEIAGNNVNDHSISVAVAKFERTPIKIVKTEINGAADSYKAGEEIAKELNQNDLRGLFVLSDGLKVNGTDLVRGLNTIQKGNISITGGLAGDGSRFQETWSVFNGEIINNSVIAVGFYGNHIQIGHGSRGGWDIFGPERRITRSENNILYELDYKPALTLYKEYLGDRASGLPATGLLFPLAIRKDENDSHQLVRTILAVDESAQSLTFAGDMPTGYLAQLMRANFDRIISAADEAGEVAAKIMLGTEGEITKPVLAVAISCVGRRLLLGERTEEETESVLEALPKSAQQIGFYSYGELSPHTTGKCDLHNQTMTLTTLCED
ncbi:hypothetical protein AQUSIP_07060 [Aquicella siphonis]|uniref:Cyclic di-GMP phosphodiesterase CdpA n=1 Tax=Aquicella siphonis TaxID=254247 RepID=A0A5E4PGD9_9COXI|nr:FIST N-terminal domain-containing protein [Aquicella siphonis]VVC75416.1 hypothetical protein AQUSIP_07060 [Aquicella siphonis]